MTELSVGTVPLPGNRSARIGEKIARQALFKVMDSIKVGSLTLHEGQDTQQETFFVEDPNRNVLEIKSLQGTYYEKRS